MRCNLVALIVRTLNNVCVARNLITNGIERSMRIVIFENIENGFGIRIPRAIINGDGRYFIAMGVSIVILNDLSQVLWRSYQR